MNDSILTSIKKLLNIANESTDFDEDVMTHINSVIMILRQMGVGPSSGFVVEDSSATWSDYIGTENIARYSAVKSYIYMKVRPFFDPSANGAVTESTNALIKELEYRLYAEAAWPTYE